MYGVDILAPIHAVCVDKDADEDTKIVSFQHMFHVIAVAYDSITHRFFEKYHEEVDHEMSSRDDPDEDESVSETVALPEDAASTAAATAVDSAERHGDLHPPTDQGGPTRSSPLKSSAGFEEWYVHTRAFIFLSMLLLLL